MYVFQVPGFRFESKIPFDALRLLRVPSLSRDKIQKKTQSLRLSRHSSKSDDGGSLDRILLITDY